ncbi:MAG: mechanosensitive ion channel, partial [Acetobacteraceae bacterium]|nr:mechanosensitive ion channel [Acetobacteraceae bacterium]
MKRLFVLFLTVVLLLPRAGQGQAPAPPITPDQARAALAVLNDPKKRAEFTATLEAIARTQAAPAEPADKTAEPAPASSSAPPAEAEAPEPSTSPLAPDSLGAEVLVSASGFLSQLSDQTKATIQAIQSIPLLWGWVVVMATNPSAREMLEDTAWRLLLTLVCGLALEYALRRAVRRPVEALESFAPAANGHPANEPPPPGSEADDHHEDEVIYHGDGETAVERAEAGELEAPQRLRRHLSALTLLRRVPFVLARLVLDLIPVLGFLLAGHVIAASVIGGQTVSRLVLLAVVDAYAVCLGLLAVARMLVSPETAGLRLFNLPNDLATYLMRWAKRLIVIAVFGYACAEVGLLLGLSAVAHEAVLKSVGFVVHVCLAIIVLQKRRAVRRLLRAPAGATGTTARLRNGLASSWHWIALFFIAAVWLVWAVEIPHGFTAVLHFFLVTAALLVGARLALILLLGSIDRAVRTEFDMAARPYALEARLRVYHPALTTLIRAIIYVLCLLGLLQLYGLGAFTWLFTSMLGQRVLSALSTLLVTVLLALAVWESVNAAIHRHLSKLQQEAQVARSARLRTLLPLLRSTLLITILVVAGLMVLSEIGVNIAPLLAGAGIIGVAIGFGSQKLVQDLINGIFLLLENAMQVGDTVTVSGLTGSVEALSVRTIRLRANDGSVHIIPFSAVTSVTNVNRGLGNASVNVVVAYEEDTDRVSDLLKSIAADMR